MGGMSGLQTSLTDIYNHYDSPLPLSYRQLVNATVRLYMVLLLLAAALTETAVAPFGQLDYGSFWIILVYAFEVRVAKKYERYNVCYSTLLSFITFVEEISLTHTHLHNSNIPCPTLLSNTLFFFSSQFSLSISHRHILSSSTFYSLVG